MFCKLINSVTGSIVQNSSGAGKSYSHPYVELRERDTHMSTGHYGYFSDVMYAESFFDRLYSPVVVRNPNNLDI